MRCADNRQERCISRVGMVTLLLHYEPSSQMHFHSTLMHALTITLQNQVSIFVDGTEVANKEVCDLLLERSPMFPRHVSTLEQTSLLDEILRI